MYKRDSINTIFEDYIIFRELNPIKVSLPSFSQIKNDLKLTFLPRKKDFEYAKVLSYLLDAIGSFEKVIYFGDTFLNDGGVIKNLAKLEKYKVLGIITEENVSDYVKFEDNIIVNTKWKNLSSILKNSGFTFDKKTVVIIDIDKTLIGARGRNDRALDKARMDAIISLAGEIFGEIDIDRFEFVYSEMNKKNMHPFTQDNQDTVAIMSIVFYGDYYNLERFIKEFYDGKWVNPLDFLNFINISKEDKAFEFVEEVKENLRMQHPTSFPTFRKRELYYTLNRMDFLPDETDVNDLINEEIMITKEVFEIGFLAKSKGSLVFGLSDKPELSSIPEDKSGEPIYLKRAKIFPK